MYLNPKLEHVFIMEHLEPNVGQGAESENNQVVETHNLASPVSDNQSMETLLEEQGLAWIFPSKVRSAPE